MKNYLETFRIWAVTATVDMFHGQLLGLAVIVFVLVSHVTVPKTFADKFQSFSFRITMNLVPNNVYIRHTTHG